MGGKALHKTLHNTGGSKRVRLLNEIRSEIKNNPSALISITAGQVLGLILGEIEHLCVLNVCDDYIIQ